MIIIISLSLSSALDDEDIEDYESLSGAEKTG